jgi:hypothetical protein
MFRVTVYKGGTQVGTIKVQGLRVHSPNGGMKIPVRFGESGTEDVPFGVRLEPDGFVSDGVVRQILSRLEIGQIVGDAYHEGEYKWYADER